MAAALTPVLFENLPGWSLDNPMDIVEGLQACAAHVDNNRPYKTGSFKIDWADFLPAIDALATQIPQDPKSARAFFENHFVPCRIGFDGGFVTGYYEPEVAVSPVETHRYRYPFYSKPGDLIKLDATNRPPTVDVACAYGRKSPDGIVSYADRKDMDCGFLKGRGLEIAWAESRIDVFFAHIQGSARLRYPDRSIRRITYSAKSGHAFTAIGQVLITLGEQKPGCVTMQSIRQWLDDNPARVDEILWHNRSYIFFKPVPDHADSQGPIGAAKVPLMATRSLAVDRQLHTFGSPIYVQADDLTHLDNAPFRRLMLAQDTGSAIIGPARGDIFTGSGSSAGEAAGIVKHAATFYLFIPKSAVGRITG